MLFFDDYIFVGETTTYYGVPMLTIKLTERLILPNLRLSENFARLINPLTRSHFPFSVLPYDVFFQKFCHLFNYLFYISVTESCARTAAVFQPRLGHNHLIDRSTLFQQFIQYSACNCFE
jgi:hypothetical protein